MHVYCVLSVKEIVCSVKPKQWMCIHNHFKCYVLYCSRWTVFVQHNVCIYATGKRGKNTPEYRTLIRCGPELSNAVKLDISTLSGELLSKGLITSENRDNLTNPMISVGHRASELVSMVRTRVELDARNFHHFIDTLLMRVNDHRDILRILDEGYKSNGMSLCEILGYVYVLSHSSCLCSEFCTHFLSLLMYLSVVIILHPHLIKKLPLLCRRTNRDRHCCCIGLS